METAAYGALLKICGIVHADDLRTCVALGVDAVGLNLWPHSPRGRSVAHHARLLERAGDLGDTRRVGVFVEPARRLVQEARRALGLDLVQYHQDRLPPYAPDEGPYVWVLRGRLDPLAEGLPDPPPAWILFDSRVAGYGGAGVLADWRAARRLVEQVAPVPVLLAGGITPDNAAVALSAVRPAGLDVASGAEAPGAPPGRKDPRRLAALVRACKSHRNVAGTKP